MKTKEILSIFALVAIVLCLICGVAKTAMKSPKQKQSCDTACSLLIFVAVVLVGISQLLDEDAGKVFNPISPGHLGARCLTGSDVSGLQCLDGSVCKATGDYGVKMCVTPKKQAHVPGPGNAPGHYITPGTNGGECRTSMIAGKAQCDKNLSCQTNNTCGYGCQPGGPPCSGGSKCTFIAAINKFACVVPGGTKPGPGGKTTSW